MQLKVIINSATLIANSFLAAGLAVAQPAAPTNPSATPPTEQDAPAKREAAAATATAEAAPPPPAEENAPADPPDAAAQGSEQPATPAPPLPAASEPVEAAPGIQSAGPSLELPEEDGVAAENDGVAPAEDASRQAYTDPTRGLRDQRVGRAAESRTSVGGYGELHYSRVMPNGDGDTESEIDLHRLVLFVAHDFGNAFRFYSELEVEHALASSSGPGEVGVEQAFMEWDLLGDALALRTGVVLVPMGIVNMWHEPPTFNGVERPMVDKLIIPSTWREGAIGIVGEPIEGLRYELYLGAGGFDPAGFSTKDGIRKGRQQVGGAKADGLSVFGRAEYEPALGSVIGLSAYASGTGPNLQGDNAELDLHVPVVGVALDARTRVQGLEARAVFATFSVGETQELREQAVNSSGAPVDVASRLLGGYAELGYNLFQETDIDQALVPFARYEYYDTTAETGGADGPAVTDLVFGVSYRPIPQAVFKGDLVVRSPEEGRGENVLNLGVGWMY